MKKSLLIIFAIMLSGIAGFAQLTGTKTIPGDYASIASAISALNTSGVGAGGVTFNVAAGYSETFTTLTDGLITTNTGSATNPILFQKSGVGINPYITGFATAPGATDYIICIAGTDYVTFNGIDLQELSGSVEWGFAILKESATNGSQNITIKNSYINLNKTFTSTIGIYSNNHTTVSTTQLPVTNVAGTNSNLKIFSNTISNCYTGIYLYGYNDASAPYAFYDQNNEIGKDGANSITNVGGGSALAYGIYARYQNNLKVANNTITSTMGGTGTNAHYGIFLTTANNASYDLYGNSVTMNFSGASDLYPIYSDMGISGTSNTMNVYNNTVSNCTYSTITSKNVYALYVMNLGVTANVYGNSVTNNTIGGAFVTSTGAIRYLYIHKASTNAGPLNVYNNMVTGNSRVQSVIGAGTTYFLWVNGNGSNLNLYNNTVDNNIIAANGSAYGIYAGFDVGTKYVYNNTVTNMQSANGSVYGLFNYSVTSNGNPTYIYRNKIQNIKGLSTTCRLYGISNSNSVGTPVYYYNNMVTDFQMPNSTGTITSSDLMRGIEIQGGPVVGLYFNTVYLNGSASSGAYSGSSALYASTSTQLDLRNNIFVNTSAHTGNGITAGIRFSSTALTNFSSLSNYNNIYAGTPGAANVIFTNGTNIDQTLVEYKTRVSPRELQSVTELPPFVNVATQPYDVHLQNNVATQCESGGITVTLPVSVTTDFDNDARFPNPGYPVNGTNTPKSPDIGFDEVGGLPNDITSPSIIYTPLGNTYNGNPRTLTASIADGGSGVTTSGAGLPMLYWKVNSGSYQAVQGTYVSGSTYSFIFGAGTVIGDVVSYYIVAQDLAASPNVGAYPWIGASGLSANPPACSAPPSTPFTYTIMTGISGIYHVGVGKDYTTLTAAATDINAKFISGPLTLILDDATYPTETYPISFNPNPGSSPTNTLTIKPNAGISPVFSGSFAGGNGILHLNGIDYMILDGSNNGSSSKNLTIKNTNTNSGAYGIQVLNNGGTDPATNVTIKNCTIQCTPVHSSVTSIVGIRFSGTGGKYDNFIINNNTIIGAFDGIQFYGSSTGVNHDCQITNNIIGSVPDAEAVTHNGIALQYSDNTLISGNDIMGPYTGSLNVGQSGIYIGTGSTNTKIRKNKIHDYYHNSDDGWGATGIWYTSDATTVTEISDNAIYDIKAPGINPGVGQNITYGIFVRSGGNLKILHNTIFLSGPFLSSLYDASSACIGFYYQATGNNNEVRNNIFRNSMVCTGAPNVNGKAYGIMISTNGLFSIIDNNDFFIDGYNGSIAQQYTNGTGAIVEYPTLASWQAYTGQEANSVTIDPVFTSSTNLLPTSVPLNNKGAYLTLVPADITGKMRNNPPDMGAYEFGNDPFVVTLSANTITPTSAILTGSANAAGVSVSTFFDYGLTSNYGTSVAAIPASVTGSTTTGFQAPISGLNYATTYHFRARTVSGGGMISYGVDSTFTTMPLPPTVITTSATSVTSSAATLNGTVNANGGSTAVTFQYGLTTAYGTTINANPNTVSGLTVTPVSLAISGLLPNSTYHFRAVATNISGTTNGNDMTFTTVAIPANVITNVATSITATGATLNGSVTANYANTTVTFQYGTTVAYGNTVAGVPGTVTGGTATAVNAPLTGLAVNTTYHFRCVGTNMAGTSYGADYIFTTGCIDPVVTINGPASTCYQVPGYVYTTQAGMNNYVWTINGGTITAGAGTNSVTVTWNTLGAQNISLNYQNSYGCSAATPTVYNVTVNALPVVTISGPASVCNQSTGNIYTTQAGNTNYQWTVNGGTITAGAGTNAITVTWTSAGSKTVSVNYSNSNGCSAASATVYNVTVNPLPVPTITGYNNLCSGTGSVIYTTEAGNNNYSWGISSGGTIVSGQGTYQLVVNWNTPGAQWITVNYSNASGCYALVPTTLNVTVLPLPGPAGAIAGTSSVCGGAQGIAYSVPAITNALTYVWTLPAGATIATGSGTNSITVDFAANASSGNITVYGNNTCGNGSSSAPFAVTVNQLPAAAGTITGPADVCQGTNGIIYSVGTIANATAYNWTVPAGATIVSGGSTNTITVDFGMNAVSGNVTVYGSNSCGNGAVSPSYAVTVNPIPVTPIVTANGDMLTSSAPSGNQWYFEGTMIPGATGQTYQATQSGWYWTVVTMSGCSSDTSNHVYILITGVEQLEGSGVSVYPVPNDGKFTVSIGSASTEPFSISVYSNLGVQIFEMKNIHVNGHFDQVIDLRPAANGIYTLVIRNNGSHIVKKVIVNR